MTCASIDEKQGKGAGGRRAALLESFNTSLQARDRLIAKLLRLHKDLDTLRAVDQKYQDCCETLAPEAAALYRRRRRSGEDRDRFRRILDKVEASAYQIIGQSINSWQHHLHLLNDAVVKLGNNIYRLLPRPQTLEEEIQNEESAALEYDELRTLNWKLLFAEILLGETAPQALAPTVNIDPSNGCNARCRTCYQSLNQDYPHSVLNEDLTRKLERLLPFVIDMKLFGVGEPTLSPALYALVMLCNRHKCPANLLTNGSTLGRKQLPLRGLSAVGISIDAVSPRTYSALRPTIPRDDLIRRMKEFHAEAPQVSMYLNVTVNRVNLDEIVGLVELATEVGATRINFTRFIAYLPHHPPLRLRKTDEAIFKTQMEKAQAIARDAGVFIDNAVVFDDFEDCEALDKEALLEGLEKIAVVGAACSYSFEEADAALKTNLPLQVLPEFMGDLMEIQARALPAVQSAWLDVDAASMRLKLQQRLKRLKSLPPQELKLPYCLSPWTKLYVEADGALRPCCVLGEMIGDLNEAESIEEAWNDPAFVQLRKGTLGECPLPASCYSCSFVERYLLLDMLLSFLDEMGVDLRSIKIPQNYQPPERIQERLRR